MRHRRIWPAGPDFCAAVAERYQERISAYQIWNEPNLSREWGDNRPDPAGYVDLLAACSGAIREARPHGDADFGWSGAHRQLRR